MANLLIDLMVLVWVLALGVGVMRAVRSRSTRPKPLSPQARDQFVAAWEAIERRFVDAPQQTVQRADSLVMSLLDERGRSPKHEQLPRELKKAREIGIARPSQGTEELRRAMLMYRKAFERMAGRLRRDKAGYRRREMA